MRLRNRVTKCGSLHFLLRMGLAGCIATLMVAHKAEADTISDPPNGNLISFWGPSSLDNQSYGVIFTAPEAVLDDFSVMLESDNPFPFVAQVYAWNGTTTVGPALFTSGVQDTTTSLTTFEWTPDITLISGDQYIAFVTNQPSGVGLGGSGNGEMAAGAAPFEFAEGDPAGGSWFTYAEDAAFNADFSASTATPEPGSLGLSLFAIFAVMSAAVAKKHLRRSS